MCLRLYLNFTQNLGYRLYSSSCLSFYSRITQYPNKITLSWDFKDTLKDQFFSDGQNTIFAVLYHRANTFKASRSLNLGARPFLNVVLIKRTSLVFCTIFVHMWLQRFFKLKSYIANKMSKIEQISKY